MRRLLFTLGVVLLSGCAAFQTPAPDPGYAPLTEAEGTALAEALTEALQRAFPPAKTSLIVSPLDPVAAPLADVFEPYLRRAGYGLSGKDAREAVTVRVHLHEPAGAQLLVRLDAGLVWRWTRLYQRQGGGLEPLSGPTVRVE
jgi:hypothetical protein